MPVKIIFRVLYQSLLSRHLGCSRWGRSLEETGGVPHLNSQIRCSRGDTQCCSATRHASSGSGLDQFKLDHELSKKALRVLVDNLTAAKEAPTQSSTAEKVACEQLEFLTAEYTFKLFANDCLEALKSVGCGTLVDGLVT